MPNFTFYGGRKQATMKFSFSFWTRIWFFRNSTPKEFAYIWQSNWVGTVAMKIEWTRIQFLSDVFAAVAVLGRSLLLAMGPRWPGHYFCRDQMYVSDTSRNPLQSWLMFHSILDFLQKISFWANFYSSCNSIQRNMNRRGEPRKGDDTAAFIAFDEWLLPSKSRVRVTWNRLWYIPCIFCDQGSIECGTVVHRRTQHVGWSKGWATGYNRRGWVRGRGASLPAGFLQFFLVNRRGSIPILVNSDIFKPT